MSTFVIDAYAWIEYFDGTEPGAIVCGIVEEEGNTIITNAVTIAELGGKFKRSQRDFSAPKKVLLALSRIEDVTTSLAEETGVLHAELRKTRKHLGLADAFVLQTARKRGAKVVTGDQDFKGLKEVVLVGCREQDSNLRRHEANRF